jgi:hypothetical protein
MKQSYYAVGQTLWSVKIRSERERVPTADGTFRYSPDARLFCEWVEWKVEKVTPQFARCRSSDLRVKRVGLNDTEVAASKQGALRLASQKLTTKLARSEREQALDVRKLQLLESLKTR